MATKVNINGKLQSRPGVYTLIKSGIQNAPARLNYGVLCIVDTGISSSWGGGKGSLPYEFNTIQDFRNFVKGGPLWDLALPLWKPVPNTNLQGVNKIILIQARETTPGSIPLSFANSNLTLTTIDEGVNVNGVLLNSSLKQGYSATFEEKDARTAAATFVTTTTVAAATGVAQINKIVVSNIKIGDTYNVVKGATTISQIATSVSPNILYNQLAAKINTSSAFTAIVATVAVDGLVLTASVVNTPFTQTSITVLVAPLFIMKLWHGSFKGTDALNNLPYEGVLASDAAPTLLAQSPPVPDMPSLQLWLNSDLGVTTGFTYVANITTTGGAFISADATNNTGNILALGGTETYNTTAFTAALNKAKEANCNFFLSTEFGADANGTNNQSLLSNAVLLGKYERAMIVAGYAAAADLPLSAAAAAAYNSDKVILTHGDGLTTIRANVFKKRSQLWKAAAIAGRLCGLTPQTPLTLKKVGIDAEANPLDETQQEFALASGVIVTYMDSELGYNVVLQGINTLQNNQFLVNDDGSSFSIAVKRITAQLNKEVAIYLKKKFFGNDTVGPNRNTITEEDVIAATEGYLQKRTASSNTDDLIIRFQNITAVVSQDNIAVNYEFVPNYEVNKLIITGIILAN